MVRRVVLTMLAGGLLTVQSANGEPFSHRFDCVPVEAVFCLNIHVSCAGRTTIPAVPFTALVAGERASVQFDPETTAVPGRVEGIGQTVIRLGESQDWIHIEEDGFYSHRIYRRGTAAMSAGTCTRTDLE